MEVEQESVFLRGQYIIKKIILCKKVMFYNIQSHNVGM